MLRVQCLQLLYSLSDPGMEDALYEIESTLGFAGLRRSKRLPDESTMLNLRHFLVWTLASGDQGSAMRCKPAP